MRYFLNRRSLVTDTNCFIRVINAKFTNSHNCTLHLDIITVFIYQMKQKVVALKRILKFILTPPQRVSV
jgi:hypothetical protein